MKITIDKEMTPEDAMNAVRDFLQPYLVDYPMVKSDISLYINLKGKLGGKCPDNDKIFHITQGGVVDVVNAKMKQSIDDLCYNWQWYIKNAQNHLNFLKKEIEKDLNYLETAEEKGRKQENIAAREAKLMDHRCELTKSQKTFDFLEELDALVQSKAAKIFCVRTKYNTRFCDDSYEVFYVFEDINGVSYYYSQWGLSRGLPEGFRSAKTM